MVFFQKPNQLLIIGFVLVLLSKLSTSLQTGLGLAASLVLAAWAIDEIRTGLNWFRRLLGSVVLITIFFNLLARIS